MTAAQTDAIWTSYPAHADGSVAGTYANHRHPAIQQNAYNLRVTGITYRVVASMLGFQRWEHAQYAVENFCRREGVECPRSFRHTVRRGVRRAAQRGLLARNYGVEVEYVNGIDHSALVRRINAAGVACTNSHYGHAVQDSWRRTTDASVRAGGEMVSPILNGEDGFASLMTVMAELRTMRAGAGHQASVHVHHDVNDLDQDALLRLANTLENTAMALVSYCADTRLSNTYAGPMNARGWNMVRDGIRTARLRPRGGTYHDRDMGSGVSRYHAFNWNSVLIYGTVEFRQHGATFSPSKIKPWIAVGQALVEFARTGNEFTTEQSVVSMLNALTLAGLLDANLARKFREGVAGREAANGNVRRRFIPVEVVEGIAA